jgi:hypothetical protein
MRAGSSSRRDYKCWRRGRLTNRELKSVAHLERMRAALERARPRDQRQRPIIAERQIVDMDVMGCGHEGVAGFKF